MPVSDTENKTAGQYVPAGESALAGSKVVQRKTSERATVEQTIANNREPGSREIVARRAMEMSVRQAEAARAAEARHQDAVDALHQATAEAHRAAAELATAEQEHAELHRRAERRLTDASPELLRLTHEGLAAAANKLAHLQRRYREAELTAEVRTVAAADAAAVAAEARAATLKNAPTPEERFAAEVRSGRERLGLTQPQLAQKLLELYGIDLAASGIARIESGQRSVRLNEVVALTELLRLSLKDYSPATTLKSDAEYTAAQRRHQRLVEQQAAMLGHLTALRAQAASMQAESISLEQQIGQLAEEIEDYRRIHEGTA